MTVPWFIGSNGALHPPEVARLLAWAATQGAEGIIGAGDMKVNALAVPGAAVDIVAGGCAMLNRSPGASFQTYIDREPGTVQVAITATGSGGGRSDLVVRRVEDPDFPSWQIPTDPVNGPYARYFILPGVPNTTTSAKQLNLGYPAIALARIDIPLSTSAILNSHIVDLRKVSNPRKAREIDALTGPALFIDTLTPKTLGTSRAIAVPEWATAATIRADFTGLALVLGNSNGYLIGKLGTEAVRATSFDENWIATGAVSRSSYAIMSEIAIPPAMRGTNQTFLFQGSRANANPGKLTSDGGTSMFVDIEFFEKAY